MLTKAFLDIFCDAPRKLIPTPIPTLSDPTLNPLIHCDMCVACYLAEGGGRWGSPWWWRRRRGRDGHPAADKTHT